MTGLLYYSGLTSFDSHWLSKHKVLEDLILLFPITEEMKMAEVACPGSQPGGGRVQAQDS